METKGRDQETLVPLTSSLYVPGKLSSDEKVIVEAGAGYFLEQSYDKAKEYIDRKVKMLSESTNKIGEVINVKKQQHAQIVTEYNKKMSTFQKAMGEQKGK